MRDLSGTGQYLTHTGSLGITVPDDPIFAIIWVEFDNTSTTQALLSMGQSGAGSERRYVDVTSNTVRAITNPASGAAVASVAYSTTGVKVPVFAEWPTASLRAIQVGNGSRVTEATTRAMSSAPNQIRIGATHTASGPFNGRLGPIGIYRGTITADDKTAALAGIHPELIRPADQIDVIDLTGRNSPEFSLKGNAYAITGSPGYADHPRLFRRRRRSMIFVPASGTDYTLTADTVAYGATATAANLLHHRKVDAQTVGFTWTPTAAALVSARKLSADSVPYAWTPTAASLRVAYRLAVDSVAYAWTPTSAALQYARRLVADSVGYAWTPSDATLVKVGDYDLIADTVGYSWAPTAATLTTARRLVCESVSYGATATDASLTVSRRLDAATVAYAWQPTAATLRTGYVMPAAAVAFTWAPTAANLRSARSMVAGSVGYLWTPTAADLEYSGEEVPPEYTVILIGAARAGAAGITARAGRTSIAARTHLSE